MQALRICRAAVVHLLCIRNALVTHAVMLFLTNFAINTRPDPPAPPLCRYLFQEPERGQSGHGQGTRVRAARTDAFRMGTESSGDGGGEGGRQPQPGSARLLSTHSATAGNCNTLRASAPPSTLHPRMKLLRPAVVHRQCAACATRRRPPPTRPVCASVPLCPVVPCRSKFGFHYFRAAVGRQRERDLPDGPEPEPMPFHLPPPSMRCVARAALLCPYEGQPGGGEERGGEGNRAGVCWLLAALLLLLFRSSSPGATQAAPLR